MFLNFYNLYILDNIAPGALVALVVAFFLSRWANERYAVREAYLRADELQLAGDDRTNFLAWKLTETMEAAETRIGPYTGIIFCGLMVLALTTGLISCSGPKSRPKPPAATPGVEEPGDRQVHVAPTLASNSH